VDRIRVLIVDDRPIFRAGSKGMLSSYDHITIVGEAVNGREAVAMAKSLKPDVILMDISMPEMDGIAATAAIKQDTNEVAILGLTASDHEDDVAQMLQAGACGYILKESGPEDLARAIEDAHAGRFPLDRSVAQRMVQRLATQRARPAVETIEPLMPKEKEILRFLMEGYPNKAIAARLSISEGTVKAHLRNIYRKLDVDSRAAAAARASQLDLGF
jgi:DNA-binding NarL/FixJ family response regulator